MEKEDFPVPDFLTPKKQETWNSIISSDNFFKIPTRRDQIQI